MKGTFLLIRVPLTIVEAMTDASYRIKPLHIHPNIRPHWNDMLLEFADKLAAHRRCEEMGYEEREVHCCLCDTIKIVNFPAGFGSAEYLFGYTPHKDGGFVCPKCQETAKYPGGERT